MKGVRHGNEKGRILTVAVLDEKAGDPAVVLVEHPAGPEKSHVAGIAAKDEPVLRGDTLDEIHVADGLPAGGDVVLRAAQGPDGDRRGVVRHPDPHRDRQGSGDPTAQGVEPSQPIDPAPQRSEFLLEKKWKFSKGDFP
jgi:hypothetical protein